METEWALAAAVACMLALWIVLVRTGKQAALYKERLKKKDAMIHKMVRALPILFVENYKDPDYSKARDGSFVFYVVTRPEYDSKHIKIEWICEGQQKKKYDSLIYRYFKELERMGLDVHPVLLGERPFKGRLMIESYYELDEDELDLFEEDDDETDTVRDIRGEDPVPVC